MKKVLILGGAHNQIPLIKKVKEMGHYVITCDYLESNPGHVYAHEYYNISIADKEGILELAKELKIDGILTYASDLSALTAAYVAEQLGLPSQPYKSVEILTYKDLFREFQKQNKFHAPNAKSYNSIEDLMKDIHKFKLPIMIKPVDSSGSRGISKVDTLDSLPKKVENALKHSKVKRFLIEEFIEKEGYHIAGDGFSVNGRLVFRSFADTFFPSTNINQFVPIGSTWPSTLDSRIQYKIHSEIQRLFRLLNMKTGAFDFDIQIDKNENVFIIEIGARLGGAWLPKVIKYATGVDLEKYTIKAALGEDCSDLTMKEPIGFWSNSLIVSSENGSFKEVQFDEQFKLNNIVEYELFVKPGENVYSLSGAHEILGVMLLKYTSQEEMLYKMKNISQFVKVVVEKSIHDKTPTTN